jgi:hypothetical protein
MNHEQYMQEHVDRIMLANSLFDDKDYVLKYSQPEGRDLITLSYQNEPLGFAQVVDNSWYVYKIEGETAKYMKTTMSVFLAAEALILLAGKPRPPRSIMDPDDERPF